MSGEIAAKRYAKALFELGVEKKCISEFEKELSYFRDLTEGGKLEFLSNPIFTKDEKKSVLYKLADKQKTSKDFKRFLEILTEEKRTEEIPDIHRFFEKFYNEHEGQEEAYVYSSVNLSSGQLDNLSKVLSKVRKKKIIIQNKIDISLIGGIKVKIGSFIYDGSVRGIIDKFKSDF